MEYKSELETYKPEIEPELTQPEIEPEPTKSEIEHELAPVKTIVPKVSLIKIMTMSPEKHHNDFFQLICYNTSISYNLMSIVWIVSLSNATEAWSRSKEVP